MPAIMSKAYFPVQKSQYNQALFLPKRTSLLFIGIHNFHSVLCRNGLDTSIIPPNFLLFEKKGAIVKTPKRIINIGATGSHVPYRSLKQVHAASIPDAAWTVSRFPPGLLSRANGYTRF